MSGKTLKTSACIQTADLLFRPKIEVCDSTRKVAFLQAASTPKFDDSQINLENRNGRTQVLQTLDLEHGLDTQE